MLKSFVNDIYDITKNKKEFDIEIWKNDKYVNGLSVELDLRKMGVDSKSDWEFSIIKDLCREIDGIIRDTEKVPSSEEIKKVMEDKQYLSIKIGR